MPGRMACPPLSRTVYPRSEQPEFTLPDEPEVMCCLVCGALLGQSEVNPHQWFEQTNRVWTQEDIPVGECVLFGSS